MIKWDFYTVIGGMAVGDSFFIPCLDVAPYRTKIKAVAEALGVTVVTHIVVENYIRGLRTWRVV